MFCCYLFVVQGDGKSQLREKILKSRGDRVKKVKQERKCNLFYLFIQ